MYPLSNQQAQNTAYPEVISQRNGETVLVCSLFRSSFTFSFARPSSSLLQDSPCEEGEGGGVQLLRLTSQERRGQRRHPGRRRLRSRGAAYKSCSVSLRGPGSSRTPGRTPALAVFGLRGAEWCNASAKAIATVCRSCLAHERSRSRCLLAAPSRSLMATAGVFLQKQHVKNGYA